MHIQPKDFDVRFFLEVLLGASGLSRRAVPPAYTTYSMTAALFENTSLSVVDSCFGEMEELSNDIESLNVYSIRADHLKSWVFKIRAMLRSLRRSFGVMRETMLQTHRPDGGLASALGFPTVHAPRGSIAYEGQLAAGRSAGMIEDLMNAAPSSGRLGRGVAPPPTTLAPYVSGAMHLMLDALNAAVQSEWCTCFLYNSRHEELVLACSVGKRSNDKPGSLRLSATSGVESHVLHTGIAINIAHTHAENEFTGAQDAKRLADSLRTKSEVVFPLVKPGGGGAHAMGVIHVCNKQADPSGFSSADGGGGTHYFEPSDETKVAECASILSAILAKFTADLTSPGIFDTGLLAPYAAKDHERLPPLLPSVSTLASAGVNPTCVRPPPTRQVQGTLIFRTARGGHLKRADVIRDATDLPVIPTVTEAVSYISKVNDAWRNAVVLNMELQKEVSRLHEALKLGKKEAARLQGTLNELRRQVEESESVAQQSSSVMHRRKSLTGGPGA